VCCKNDLKEGTDAGLVVLGAGLLDDVAVIVNVLALLLEHKPLEELGQDLVERAGQSLVPAQPK
jgi:hypothetical protein